MRGQGDGDWSGFVKEFALTNRCGRKTLHRVPPHPPHCPRPSPPHPAPEPCSGPQSEKAQKGQVGSQTSSSPSLTSSSPTGSLKNKNTSSRFLPWKRDASCYSLLRARLGRGGGGFTLETYRGRVPRTPANHRWAPSWVTLPATPHTLRRFPQNHASSRVRQNVSFVLCPERK